MTDRTTATEAELAETEAGCEPVVDRPRPAAIGPYEILGELGRGGMGIVYLARDPRLDREVALKILRLPGNLLTDRVVERFLREARTAGRLAHPNLVGVFEVGRAEGEYFLTMERLSGRSLGDLLAEEGPLAPERSVGLVATIARAVAVAHDGGVVHRDLKPSNLIFDLAGALRVTDFGLALEVDGPRRTRAGEILGTPLYMAPEQAAGRVDRIDARTDVHALGAILFELLTGRPPYDGRSIEQLLHHIRQLPPPRPEGAPADLDRIVRRALAKEREGRHPTAAALADDLEAFLAGRSSGRPFRLRWPGRSARAPVTERAAAEGPLAVPLAVAWRRLERAVLPGASEVELVRQVRIAARSGGASVEVGLVPGEMGAAYRIAAAAEASGLLARWRAGRAARGQVARLRRVLDDRPAGEELPRPIPAAELGGALDAAGRCWQVDCARCRLPVAVVATLDRIDRAASCPACREPLDLDLDRDVHLLVDPSGPGLAEVPWVAGRWSLARGQRVEIALDPSTDRRLVFLPTLDALAIEADPNGPDRLEVVRTADGWSRPAVGLRPGPARLLAENAADAGAVVLEREVRRPVGLSAAAALLHPAFRARCPDEFPAGEGPVAAGQATYLALHLEGATGVHARLGEALAMVRIGRYLDAADAAVAAAGGAIVGRLAETLVAALPDRAAARVAVGDLTARLAAVGASEAFDRPLIVRTSIAAGPTLLRGPLDHLAPAIEDALVGLGLPQDQSTAL